MSAPSLPRVELAPLPTPLVAAPRFSAAIGAEVWIKRDDVGTLGLAGNKVRKLEYTLAEATAQGADTIMIIGAAQSNAARATAAACAQLGLRCVLVLSGDGPDGAPAGNLLLDTLFGAEIHHAGRVGWVELWERSQEVADELRENGATPYTLPAGSSSPLGACGFVRAWDELAGQLRDQDLSASTVFHASSSGGTAAGLHLGRAIGGRTGPQVRSIGVDPNLGDHIPALADGAAELIGSEVRMEPGQIAIDLNWIGDGYGIPTPEGLEAIRLLARTEAIVCDPVYSGKALAALVAADHDGPTVFWHTGGWPALFAPDYGAAVARA